MITPRTLKGFRDFLPETMLTRQSLLTCVQHTFASFGFTPIDTPALEYLEILQGKGSDETDKQIYKFTDNGGREVGLRFDLTIPFARFAAQHIDELGTPFKRYHIAKVWRGENTQAGRYREFTQCDFDTIGTKSLTADIETALVINTLLQYISIKERQKFESFTRFKIHINNRKILNGLLDKLGISDKTTAVLRSLDKLNKIGKAAVIAEMSANTGIPQTQAETVLRLAELSGSNDEKIAALQKMLDGNQTGETGIAEVSTLLQAVNAAGVPPERIVLDVSIARGLDYYTGTIYETFLDDLPEIGSVCSGGRYDNLAGLFTKQELPGVGASLGLDRLLAAMETLGMTEKRFSPVPFFMPFFAENRLNDYLRITSELRSQDIGIEFYPEAKKLGQQLKYADRRGFTWAVIIGEDEFAENIVQLKNLKTGQSEKIPLPDLVEVLHRESQILHRRLD
ncbi:histidine--tRNA ligase [Planctomycetales bacterium]|nr:histidine--tRNA ligase [Planctomycetales bacterium]GHT37946.1 histidine--tRNA ligase [Planctomycetales bacterium]